MAKFIWITFLVAAAVCAANAGRIIGGDYATIDKYPSVVQVESRVLPILWSQICGGVILTPQNIMSAAQCFDGILALNRNRRIRAGTSSRGHGGATYHVDRVVKHHSYGSQGNDGDLCLVRLETRMVFGPTIDAASIPPQGYKLPENMPVTFVGWGSVKQGEDASDVMRHVETHTINESLCSQLYSSLSRPEVITYNMICAGGNIFGGKGACDGDWGGPMFYDKIVVGIMSLSHTCKDPRMPTVCTSTSSYTNWIVQNAN